VEKSRVRPRWRSLRRSARPAASALNRGTRRPLDDPHAGRSRCSYRSGEPGFLYHRVVDDACRRLAGVHRESRRRADQRRRRCTWPRFVAQPADQGGWAAAATLGDDQDAGCGSTGPARIAGRDFEQPGRRRRRRPPMTGDRGGGRSRSGSGTASRPGTHSMKPCSPAPGLEAGRRSAAPGSPGPEGRRPSPALIGGAVRAGPVRAGRAPRPEPGRGYVAPPALTVRVKGPRPPAGRRRPAAGARRHHPGATAPGRRAQWRPWSAARGPRTAANRRSLAGGRSEVAGHCSRGSGARCPGIRLGRRPGKAAGVGH